MSLASKVLSPREAIRLIRDGEQVALGGHTHRRHPMGLVYEVVRQRKRNLRILGWNNGMDVDILVGAGCVREVQTSYVGMGRFGLARNFRRAAEKGTISVVEESELTALDRFRAGAMGIPFLPTTSPLGSDLMRFQSQTVEMCCPFSGRKVAALRAAHPDVALIHAHKADSSGNVQLDEFSLRDNLADVFIAKSARLSIVSVEELVPSDALMERPHQTVLPAMFVSAVVRMKYGAHPCCCDMRYDYDSEFTEQYYASTESPEDFAAFLEQYVFGISDHQSYLKQAKFPRE